MPQSLVKARFSSPQVGVASPVYNSSFQQKTIAALGYGLTLSKPKLCTVYGLSSLFMMMLMNGLR
jgi:hypothetical protein